MANLQATIVTSTNPVVTKVVKGQVTLSSISGVDIDYTTIANNYTLTYNSYSNTFTATVPSVDGGVHDNGTF